MKQGHLVLGAMVSVEATLLRVGLEVMPVYGSRATGFSPDDGDFMHPVPDGARYNTLDELFFALVNLNVSQEGLA